MTIVRAYYVCTKDLQKTFTVSYKYFKGGNYDLF